MVNKALTCIAIDDEPEALEIIKIHFEKIPFVDLKAFFTHPLEAVEYLHQETVDFILLDIQMPDISGIELAKSLQNPPLIIFTTAYPQFAVESYNVDAVDFLVKPIVLDRLLKAILKVQKQLAIYSKRQPSSNFFFLKSGNGQIKIQYNSIIYLESDGNYLKFVTKEENHLGRMSLSEMEQNLTERQFLRIHKSYIINVNYLKTIESHRLSMGDEWLPIGRKYKKEVTAYLDEFDKGK